MAIFLDSAMPDDVKRARALGFVAGITTNPEIMARTGRPGLEVLADLLQMFPAGPVCYQVTALTADERITEARRAHELDPGRVVVKIPAIPENLDMLPALDGITFLITSVFTPTQAYIAAQAGARYVAPYLHQITTDIGDGIGALKKMVAYVEGTGTEILAANMTSVDEIAEVLYAGAHHVTLPINMIEAMFTHEYSYRAISRFEAAVEAHLKQRA